MQEFCIRVDPVLPNIDLKVSGEMAENVQDEYERSDSDDDLFPDRRLVKCDDRIIGELPDSNGGRTCCGHNGKITKKF